MTLVNTSQINCDFPKCTIKIFFIHQNFFPESVHKMLKFPFGRAQFKKLSARRLSLHIQRRVRALMPVTHVGSWISYKMGGWPLQYVYSISAFLGSIQNTSRSMFITHKIFRHGKRCELKFPSRQRIFRSYIKRRRDVTKTDCCLNFLNERLPHWNRVIHET